jgi:iron complex outermembrane recepter protein
MMAWIACMATASVYAQTPESFPAETSSDRSAVKARPTRVFGMVVDKNTNEILIGATLEWLETKSGTKTNTVGRYDLALPPSSPETKNETSITTLTLICRYVGYKTEMRRLRVASRSVNEVTREENFTLEPDAVKAGEVIVSGETDKAKLLESSQPVDVMSKQDLQEHIGQTLGETLQQIPGVTTLQTGPSISKPVIRGLHSQRVLIINSGLRQEGQQWGEEHAPEIDPFAAAQIEVLKGARSVEYGSDAIGGVIRIEPRPLPSLTSTAAELTMNGFSNNRQGAMSGFLERGFANGIGLRVQASYRKAGDALSPNYRLNNTAFNELDFSAMLGVQKTWGTLSLYASRFSTELGIFRGAHIGNISDLIRTINRGEPAMSLQRVPFSYSITVPRQEVSHDLVSLEGQFNRFPLGDLRVIFGFQRNERREYDAQRIAARDGIPTLNLALYSTSLEAKVQHKPIGDVTGVVGVSGMFQFNDRRSAAYLIPDFTSLTGGIFIREEYVKENFSLNAGVRYDYRFLSASPFIRITNTRYDTTRNFQAVTAAAGGVIQLGETWSIASNLSSAWRAPNVSELFSDGIHHSTATYEVGDRNLAVERSYNLDLTLREQGQRSELEVSAYLNRIQNFIFLEPTGAVRDLRGSFLSARYSQNNAQLVGIDGSGSYDFFDRLRLSASIAIVRGFNRDRNEPLYAMPGDRLRLGAHFHLPAFSVLKDPYIEANALFVRRQDRVPLVPLDRSALSVANVLAIFPDVPPEEALATYQNFLNTLTLSPAGYALYDLSVGGELSVLSMAMKLRLSVQNIFNTRYRDYLSRFRLFTDDQGRNIVLRVQVGLNNSAQ